MAGESSQKKRVEDYGCVGVGHRDCYAGDDARIRLLPGEEPSQTERGGWMPALSYGAEAIEKYDSPPPGIARLATCPRMKDHGLSGFSEMSRVWAASSLIDWTEKLVGWVYRTMGSTIGLVCFR